jgi:hypothetical protein
MATTAFKPTALAQSSSTMSDIALYTPETDAVDWRELADQVFPAEALRTAPAINPSVFMKVHIAHR